MSYILNIGLAREGLPNLQLSRVLDEVRNAGFNIESATRVESDTEATVVLTVTNGYSFTPLAIRASNLALELQQDCIALYDPAGARTGLYGPRAAAWGDFNPEFFFMPNRQRLAQPA